MSDETEPNLKVVSSQELDEEEKEFRALRRDLPGVKGAAEVGMLTIGVGRQPTPKNEFYPHASRFSAGRATGGRRGRDGSRTTSRWRPT